jgi:hypothetical protein
MYEAFIDLDELTVRCRDKQAKQFIKEAIACYKALAIVLVLSQRGMRLYSIFFIN